MNRRYGVSVGGINTQIGKGLGERRASKGDRRGGAADSGLRRRAQGRRGRGAEQVAKLQGERRGERSARPGREGGVYRKWPYPSGTAAREIPLVDKLPGRPPVHPGGREKGRTVTGTRAPD